MTIEELTRFKVTFGGKKDRSDLFDLSHNAALKNAIEECLKTGKATTLDAGVLRFEVSPEYPLVETVMERPENQSLLKVHIAVFTRAFNLGVRSEAQEFVLKATTRRKYGSRSGRTAGGVLR